MDPAQDRDDNCEFHEVVADFLLAAERLSRRLKQALLETANAKGVNAQPFTFAHYRLLNFVVENKGRSKADAAEALGVPSGQITNLLWSLKADDARYPGAIEFIVEEERNPYGRLKTALAATPAGRRFRDATWAAVTKEVDRVRCGLSFEHRAALEAIAGRVLELAPLPDRYSRQPSVSKVGNQSRGRR